MKDDPQGRIPFEHALYLYQIQEPGQIEQRIQIPYQKDEGCFVFCLLGKEASLTWPGGVLKIRGEQEVFSYVLRILVLRYFALGKHVPVTGRRISYKEIPDGLVYYPNFYSRTILGLAQAFDQDPALFDPVVQEGAEASLGDRSLEVEWINGVPVTYVCWEGDEEFSPSANILFDESIQYYFNAEDLAVLPDVGIAWLKGKGVIPLNYGMYDSSGRTD